MGNPVAAMAVRCLLGWFLPYQAYLTEARLRSNLCGDFRDPN